MEAFLATVVLGSVLEAVPATERAAAVHRVAARLPEPAVHYVRLQAAARRPGLKPLRLSRPGYATRSRPGRPAAPAAPKPPRPPRRPG